VIEYETRVPPQEPALIAAAKGAPGGWVYDIDHVYPDDQPVPSEAIRGSWEVDARGNLTGRFARNARYRALRRSTRTLEPYVHAGAKTNRDQWIVEIDPRGEALFPEIPPHLIRGWWYVDKDGKITDQFRPNSLWTT
jgi:hypothetical protein